MKIITVVLILCTSLIHSMEHKETASYSVTDLGMSNTSLAVDDPDIKKQHRLHIVYIGIAVLMVLVLIGVLTSIVILLNTNTDISSNTTTTESTDTDYITILSNITDTISNTTTIPKLIDIPSNITDIPSNITEYSIISAQAENNTVNYVNDTATLLSIPLKEEIKNHTLLVDDLI
ncbi:hypothetical protein NEOKW01_2056 [Nematocida sp. AWRm80]|nr:hypothetical protein NEOKW01_2056 [Nematocida sp. AWRm80]